VLILAGAGDAQIAAARAALEPLRDQVPAVAAGRVLVVTDRWAMLPASHMGELAVRIAQFLHATRTSSLPAWERNGTSGACDRGDAHNAACSLFPWDGVPVRGARESAESSVRDSRAVVRAPTSARKTPGFSPGFAFDAVGVDIDATPHPGAEARGFASNAGGLEIECDARLCGDAHFVVPIAMGTDREAAR
jgi:hypothetical protein